MLTIRVGSVKAVTVATGVFRCAGADQSVTEVE
jgi:hypothetical protein